MIMGKSFQATSISWDGIVVFLMVQLEDVSPRKTTKTLQGIMGHQKNLVVLWDSLEFHFLIYLESLNTWDASYN